MTVNCGLYFALSWSPELEVGLLPTFLQMGVPMLEDVLILLHELRLEMSSWYTAHLLASLVMLQHKILNLSRKIRSIRNAAQL